MGATCRTVGLRPPTHSSYSVPGGGRRFGVLGDYLRDAVEETAAVRAFALQVGILCPAKRLPMTP